MRNPFNRSRLVVVIFNALVTIGCYSAMNVPTEAATLNVPSTQYPTIQSAINAANRGDTIIVEAGRTYTENLVLRYKASGTGYVTIQSSALANLPAVGNRVSPADAANMPRIQTSGGGDSPVIRTELTGGGHPASYYKLIGLELTRTGSNNLDTIIMIGYDSQQNTVAKAPTNVIIDRCYIHGDSIRNTRRGITMNGMNSEMTNSYISEFHEVGADTQAILVYNSPGNLLIANNYLEAAAENIMIGGADPATLGLVPDGIIIENNHLFKPLAWKTKSWTVKNIIELKNAKNVIIRNNILENVWAQAQGGMAFMITVRNQSGGAVWSTVENILIEFNIIKNVGSGITITSSDDINPSQNTKNVTVRENLFFLAGADQGAQGHPLLTGNDDEQTADDVTLAHNTFIHTNRSGGNHRISLEESGNRYLQRFKFNDNIIASFGNTSGGVVAGGEAGTTALNVSVVNGQWEFKRNVLQRSSSNHPSTSVYVTTMAAIGFENPGTGDFRLKSSSPFRGAGSNGNDIGANVTELNRRTACVVSGHQGQCNLATSSTAHDYDGDGRADVTLFRPSSGVWYMNQSRDGELAVGFGLGTDVVTPGDFDGDGTTDIAVYRSDSGTWYFLNSSTWSMSARQFGLNGDIPVIADYDGDGKADIAVWRPSDGFWYRLNSSNGDYVATKFGMLGDRPMTGDFDGDGQTDLAIFRPTTGVWYLQRSTDGFFAVRFGLETDKVVPADYDGDGRTDIAVYRPSNGTWYQLDQSTGQLSAFKFGIADDIPVPADYDGDGKDDHAVFRPSSGHWYIQKSTEGFTAFQYGMAADLPTVSLLYN